jgi:hypothetical protein
MGGGTGDGRVTGIAGDPEAGDRDEERRSLVGTGTRWIRFEAPPTLFLAVFFGRPTIASNLCSRVRGGEDNREGKT